jgi:outer membrane protein
MFRSSIVSALAVCAAGLFSTSVASAQMKVGIIDFQRAVLETAEVKKAASDMQNKYKPRQEAVEKAQRELNDIQTQFQASQGKLSAAGEAELQARGQRKQREVQRLTDDLNADVNAERDTIVQRAGQRITDIVKKIAEEKGLDLVVDRANAVFFKPSLEITSDVIAGYDKAYPVKP